VEIVYLKLINGDEIFAEYHGDHENTVLLSNVMIMEAISTPDETVKYLFMSRYSPYSILHSMSIDRSKIVFLSEATETVRKHYNMSVVYAIQVTDRKFQEGISEATSYIQMAINKIVHDDTVFEDQPLVVGPESQTKH